MGTNCALQVGFYFQSLQQLFSLVILTRSVAKRGDFYFDVSWVGTILTFTLLPSNAQLLDSRIRTLPNLQHPSPPFHENMHFGNMRLVSWRKAVDVIHVKRKDHPLNVLSGGCEATKTSTDVGMPNSSVVFVNFPFESTKIKSWTTKAFKAHLFSQNTACKWAIHSNFHPILDNWSTWNS